MSEDAEDFQKHERFWDSHPSYTYKYSGDSAPVRDPNPAFESKPTAAKLRAVRSKLRSAAVERWQGAVRARLEYARDHDEPLLDFLSPGLYRWWLKIVYGARLRCCVRGPTSACA